MMATKPKKTSAQFASVLAQLGKSAAANDKAQTLVDASTAASTAAKTAMRSTPGTSEDPDVIAARESAKQANKDVRTATKEAGGIYNVATGEGYIPGTANDTSLTDEEKANRQSAYDVLLDQFSKYGLSSLVTDVKDLLLNRTPASQISLALANTDAYKKRFSANQDRIAAGLRALTPAEYVSKEDAYQTIMRQYGLPASYYSKDATGKQAGFDKLIAADIDDAELEDRVATAQKRVLNTNPEVLKALRQFYPDINNADILAYTLDPKNAIQDINRKVTAAEIGGAALQQGLQAQGGTAEALAGQGLTKAQAQAGYANVAEMLPRGSQLADIYGQGPYNQQTAEAEVFNTAGAAEATRKRKKLSELETASFSGSSGVGALGRDRANPYGTTQSGYGSY
jgi:hypothetical protein